MKKRALKNKIKKLAAKTTPVSSANLKRSLIIQQAFLALPEHEKTLIEKLFIQIIETRGWD